MSKATPRVEIPSRDADRPAMGRVGIIAAVGFVIGIAWPKLTGTHITPNPPNDALGGAGPASAGAPAAQASAPKPAPSASAAPKPDASAARAEPEAPAAVGVRVAEGTISRCRDAKGEVKGDCGALLFDPIAVPRLSGLAKCPAAAGAAGRLTVAIDVDFKRKAVHVHRGRPSTLPKATGAALMKCAEAAFANVSLDETPHDHQRYSLAYGVTFGEAPKEPAAEAAGAAGVTTNETPASGTATVRWDAVRVRSAPKAEDVVGRVLRDAKVTVIGRQADWIHIRFGASQKDGWVYRTAIGM